MDLHESGGSVENVLDYLKSRNVQIETIERFKAEKMDAEAITVSNEESLQQLGLQAKGDIFAVKAWAQRQIGKPENSSSTDYDDKKKKLLDILKKGKSKRMVSPETKPEKQIKNQAKKRRVILGWMNYDSKKNRYVSVRLTNGGGPRKVDLDANSTTKAIIDEAKELFFPLGVSSAGEATEMSFGLANFKSEPIDDYMQQEEPFTLQAYIEFHRLTQVRLYLTSRKKPVVKDDSDDDDLQILNDAPGPSDIKDGGRSWRMKYAGCQQDDDTDSDSDVDLHTPSFASSPPGTQKSSLIGSSQERKDLIEDQDEEYKKSLEEDQKKKIQAEQQSLEDKRLEGKRLARMSRVPPQPEEGTPRVRVAVHHLTKGKLIRFFSTGELMMAVYDWVGSQDQEPETFRLFSYPFKEVRPTDGVYDCTLYMEVSQDPVLIDDDGEVTFKGFGTPDGAGSESDYDTELKGSDDLGNCDLQYKKNVAFCSLDDTTEILVSRDDITRNLLNVYKDDSNLCSKRAHFILNGESGEGDGSQREVYSLFWDNILSDSEGCTEYTVPFSSMYSPEDYIAIGKIITHQFVLTGTFPVRLAEASIQDLLFDKVSDTCLINSFLKILQPKERECMADALAGRSFDANTIMGILQDYNPRAMPNSANIKSLVLSAARDEFTRKPFFCLTKIREGMGSFWNEVTSADISSLYELCKPTASKVISLLRTHDSSDSKEAQVFSWLERYLRSASDSIVVKFVRFCTATDVLDLAKPILVQTELMPPAAIRPRARTCFHTLILAKNYASYKHFRTNLEMYLNDTDSWIMID